MAQGEWITFVDADDTVAEDYFERISSITEECDMFVWRHSKQTAWGVNPCILSFDSLLSKTAGHLENIRPVWNKAFKRQIISEHNLIFDEKIHMGEDYLFVLTYLHYIKHQICWFEQKLYNYNRDNRTLSRKHYPINTLLNWEQNIIEEINRLGISKENKNKLLMDRRRSIINAVYY